MTRDETARLLDQRHALTGQPSGARTIDAWHNVLTNVDYTTARDAIRVCATTHSRIGLPEIFAALPKPYTETHHEPVYTGPIVPFHEGIRIARAAYVQQLIDQGATPDDANTHADTAITAFARIFPQDATTPTETPPADDGELF